jgi:acetyl-CoA acetyltransferase
MGAHPFHNVAIAAINNTTQGRVLEGHDSFTISLEAARSLVEKSRIDRSEIDGVIGCEAKAVAYSLGLGPVWISDSRGRITTVLEAASLIAAGVCKSVLVLEGRAGMYVDRSATAPWTRPENEFVAPFGMYTTVQFALIARRHMEMFGTPPEALATVASTIRNNGHINPDAVYFGKGPYTPEDVLESRMIADPFHVLDCAMVAEGACAILLTSADRAADVSSKPVYILGGGGDAFGPGYTHAPRWDLTSGTTEEVNGHVGARAARSAFKMAGLRPSDVDCCELYDPFSFEIIRQLEAFGFCEEGQGADLVMDGFIAPSGRCPVATDGGLLSYSHGGAQLLQRVARGVEQIAGSCVSNQIPSVKVALCSNGGAGALFTDVIILGSERP